jgi:GTP-binding protein EngB required for normal cell division
MQRINGAYESVSDDARRANYDESMARAARRRRAEDRERTPWIGATMRNGAYGRLMDLVARVDRDGVFGLTLPTIVVVGLESHGKSSLMERVALRDVFPRGVGFVTRMPIKLQLRQVNFENSVTIRLVHLIGSAWVPVEDSGPLYDIGQRNFAEVVAERMQQFISQRGQGSGNRQIAIDHRIEIRAADLVDIDLLDLPGIVSMPQDVAAASLQLTRDFLERDDTLALCVVEDLLSAVRSSLALGEIGRVDGLGARTIVVLTKVDMLTQQNPARLAHRLANPADTVGFEPTAFIPVINRGEHDGKSLTDALDAEEATFTEWKRTTPGLQLETATRRLREVREETASLGALPVSRELFLDRLCEVVSEQLAKLDGSTSTGLPSDIKVWSFDWMTALSFPANCERAGRFDRVRRRMRAKANWKLIVESVPSKELVRKLIS